VSGDSTTEASFTYFSSSSADSITPIDSLVSQATYNTVDGVWEFEFAVDEVTGLLTPQTFSLNIHGYLDSLYRFGSVSSEITVNVVDTAA
jgi:hypothetical protein